MSKKYNIEEIRRYFEGWLFLKNGIENHALENAIRNIEDDEDGIEAMIKKGRKDKKCGLYA